MTTGRGRSQPALRRRRFPAVRARSPRRGRSHRGRIGLHRPRLRALIALALLVAVLVGGWLWLRDSALVAVLRVRVSGASGPDAPQIRAALIAAAHNMTTLDVRMSQLQTAVAPYPVVKRLLVQTQFPHGMRIEVVEQVPVAVVAAGGRRTAVSGDGTLLHDAGPTSSLPTISLGVPPGGTHLIGWALREARMLAAAPYQLLAKVSQVSDGPAHGLVAQLRAGPSLYFGDSTQLGLKWTAVTDVLADPASAGAVYIDVAYPSRPVAGVGSDTAAAGATTSAAPAVTSTAPAATTTSTAGATAPAATTTSTAGATAPTAAATTSTAGGTAPAAATTTSAGTASAPANPATAPAGSTAPTGTVSPGG